MNEQELNDLISEGDNYIGNSWTNPLHDFWVGQMVEAAKQWGDSAGDVMSRAQSHVVYAGRPEKNQENENVSIRNMQDLLRHLMKKPAVSKASPSPTKPAEAPVSGKGELGRQINIEHLHANSLNLGDHGVIFDITISDVVTALDKEIEKVEDPEERKRLRDHLKALTENPVVAAVIGASVGAFLNAQFPETFQS